MLFALTLVTVVAAFSLGFVYRFTKGPIEEARLAKQLRAIEAVVNEYDNDPVADKFMVAYGEGTDSLEFYPARSGNDLSGMAIKTVSSKGYSGEIWIMVGFNPDNTITEIFVVEHLETPGLGSKMTDLEYRGQYIGKDPGKSDLRVTKDGGEVQAISGATITSRAYSEAVQLAYETYLKYQSDGKGD